MKDSQDSEAEEKSWWPLSLSDSLIILIGKMSKTAHFAQCGRVGVDVFGARQSMADD